MRRAAKRIMAPNGRDLAEEFSRKLPGVFPQRTRGVSIKRGSSATKAKLVCRSRHSLLGEARDLRGIYQRSLRPNWIWREVVEVDVITPAVGETPEGVKTTALGRLKFARLRRLNISARN